MAMKPLHNFVLLKVEPERKTASGIVLASGKPDPSSVHLERGTVLSLGPGLVNDSGQWTPMSVAVDDVVLFNRHAGISVPDEPGRYLASERDVMAVSSGPTVDSWQRSLDLLASLVQPSPAAQS